jgi:hypothetical protein
MRRTIWPWAGALLAAAALGSDSPREYDDTTIQVDRLEGEWSQIGRRTKNDLGVLQPQIVIRPCDNGMYKVECLAYALLGSHTTVRIDLGHQPARMSVTSTGAGVVPLCQCIYRLDGDTLLIGCMRNPSTRPSSFESEGVYLQAYKRVPK